MTGPAIDAKILVAFFLATLALGTVALVDGYDIEADILAKPDLTTYRVEFYEGKMFARRRGEVERHTVATFCIEVTPDGGKTFSGTDPVDDRALFLNSRLGRFIFMDPSEVGTRVVVHPAYSFMMKTAYTHWRWGLHILSYEPPNPEADFFLGRMKLRENEYISVAVYFKSGYEDDDDDRAAANAK
jgi:hypothetical protein